MAKVDKPSKNLVLLSSVDEQALKLWLINDKVYYAAYSTETGSYALRSYISGATVADPGTVKTIVILPK